MAKILLIYTGGTIGMVADAATGALKPLDFSELENEIPALRRLGVDISHYENFTPLDSSDVTPEDWVRMARVIAENYDAFDGFVVLHGTDTMAWTASAMSFVLPRPTKPVVFTGSQIPIGVLRTDGRENLVTAVEIAAATRPGTNVAAAPEVSIYFQNRLFRANRTTKWSAEQLNAFTSENFPPLAEVGVTIHYNRDATTQAESDANRRNPEVQVAPRGGSKGRTVAPGGAKPATDFCTDVSLIRLFPGMRRRTLEAMLDVAGLRGVVLQTFGAGNTPTAEWFFEVLQAAIARGIVVVNVTQCIAGGVSALYESAVRLAGMGVVSGGDMTLEAAMTKLMWTLGQGLSYGEVVRLMGVSVRGELTE